MKIGAVVICANEWRFMPAVVGQLTKFVDHIAVVRNSYSFAGSPVQLTPTPQMFAAITFKGRWFSEAETRNAGLDLLDDCDYVITLDSDEILLDEDLKHLRQLCERDTYPAIGSPFVNYWKTPEWRLVEPAPGLVGCVAVRRGTRYTKLRRVEDGQMVFAKNCLVHHLSYVRTDDEMREKLRNFAHADEINPDWFQKVWLKWTPEMKNLHPILSTLYQRAIHAPNTELIDLLTTYGVV